MGISCCWLKIHIYSTFAYVPCLVQPLIRKNFNFRTLPVLFPNDYLPIMDMLFEPFPVTAAFGGKEITQSLVYSDIIEGRDA